MPTVFNASNFLVNGFMRKEKLVQYLEVAMVIFNGQKRHLLAEKLDGMNDERPEVPIPSVASF